ASEPSLPAGLPLRVRRQQHHRPPISLSPPAAGRVALVALCVCLAAVSAPLGSQSVVDMKGRLVSVEAATAITTQGATGSIPKLGPTLSDGRSSEEIIPETADPQADLDPQILLDAESGDLLVIWSRYDGRRMTLAAARRDPSGTWSSTTYLETGKDEPSAPRA